MSDMIHHPAHYTSGRMGFECIEMTRLMPFCSGNAAKYVFRADDKGNPVQDLEKARVYAYWAWEELEAVALPGKRDALEIVYYRHISPLRAQHWAADVLGFLIFESWERVVEGIDARLDHYRLDGGDA